MCLYGGALGVRKGPHTQKQREKRWGKILKGAGRRGMSMLGEGDWDSTVFEGSHMCLVGAGGSQSAPGRDPSYPQAPCPVGEQ